LRDSLIIFAATAALRTPFVSKPYFADGPAHILAIQNRTFLIQPPGYWLFNRTAALFPNPAIGISVMNILFASLGAVVFYAVAKRLMDLTRARAATALYASVFYAWFSAEVHSTYASQLLFPVLTFYCLLRSQKGSDVRWLYAAAIAFSIGAGMRPSDGVFLLPMVLFFIGRYARTRRAVGPVLVAAAICLAWFIPTYAGFANLRGLNNTLAYASNVMSVVSVAHLDKAWTANVARLFVPLILAFGAIVAGLWRRWDEDDELLAIWIAPGFLFFLFSYISDAPYLNYFTAAIILLCARAASIQWIVVAAAINAAIFLFVPPICTDRAPQGLTMPIKVVNHYVLKYTLPETRHERMKSLSEDRDSCY
jgi:4-amino-4-deoxy-L-arabinose transferase-like glycosyltransferase